MFTILFQDDDLLAITKPCGYFVHPTALDRSVEEIVLNKLSEQVGAYLYPVHRLDRPTSGVLLFALNSYAAQHISAQFFNQKVAKIYHALTRGWVDKTKVGLITTALKAKHHNSTSSSLQEATTYYYGLSHTEVPLAIGSYQTARYSLVALQPLTGRYHQLRRHLNYLSHPIIGDSSHGDLRHNQALKEKYGLNHLMLHASFIKLTHPKKGIPLLIHSPLTEDFSKLLKALSINFITCPSTFKELSSIKQNYLL